jgi:hypothetical protein
MIRMISNRIADMGGDMHGASKARWNPGLLVDPKVIVRWQFEPGAAIVTDTGTTGTNHLGNVGVASYTSDRREGKGCADFELSEGDYMGIGHAQQSAGFPLKGGTTNKKMTICVWIKPESLPGAGAYAFIVSKEQSGQYCFDLTIQNIAGTMYLRHAIGYNGNASIEVKTASIPFVAGRWYHVAYSFDDSTKGYHIRIYGRTEDATWDATANFTNNISLDNVPWTLGVFHSLSDESWYDGLMDEFVLFNDVYGSADIDLVRKGKYKY